MPYGRHLIEQPFGKGSNWDGTPGGVEILFQTIQEKLLSVPDRPDRVYIDVSTETSACVLDVHLHGQGVTMEKRFIF